MECLFVSPCIIIGLHWLCGHNFVFTYGTKVVITKQNDIGFGYTLTRIIHIETHDVDKEINYKIS